MRNWTKAILSAILVAGFLYTLMATVPVSAGTWDPNLGWDFEAHSNTHPYYGKLTDAQIRAEEDAVNAAFTAHGYPVPQHMAYPYGDYGKTARDQARIEGIVAQYRKSARMVWGDSMTYPVTNWYELKAAQLKKATRWKTIKGWVDTCIASKTLLSIFTHDVSATPSSYGCTPTMLAQLLDYLVQQQNAGKLSVMTMAQAYDYWSTATAGKATVVVSFDDAYSTDYTAVYPLFKARGLKGTSYIVTSFIGQSGQLTWDQIALMRAGA